MAMKFDCVAEPVAAYDADIDYDIEHRCAEHEHAVQAKVHAGTKYRQGVVVGNPGIARH
jgi:hypothetical protein